ncbi:RHS repeat domain-containing protein, partial [Bdellovibrio bacteriovorus]|uniref:RHS repeat domain-containing protein n=1 Tax=Bdellovibrio bacteriovorus TaxID=959 RepID=UPI000A6D8E6F
GTHLNSPDYMNIEKQFYKIIKDHLGSPRLLVDAVSGKILQIMEYTAWGKITKDTNPGIHPFGFAGGLRIGDEATLKFGSREYDPETARWMSRDPVSFWGSPDNLYIYAGNDPINLVDPLGLTEDQMIAAENWLRENMPELFNKTNPKIEYGPAYNEMGWDVYGQAPSKNRVIINGDFIDKKFDSDKRMSEYVITIAHEVLHTHDWLRCEGWSAELADKLMKKITTEARENEIEDFAKRVGKGYMRSLKYQRAGALPFN